MGCDIHLITQIKKDGKWKTINEIPESFDNRNYTNFAILADVRNDFNIDHFNRKGLPEDIGAKKYFFVSEYSDYKKTYETGTREKVLLPDGSYVEIYNPMFKKEVSKEEAKSDKYDGYSYCGDKYTVRDYGMVGGIKKDIPIKDLETEEEYWKKQKDAWDEDAKDYGYWQIDFDSVDYHSHSYLSLKELDEFDLSNYLKTKVKVSKVFYDKFIEFGGTLPKEMTVQEHIPSNIVDAFKQTFDPDVIISFDNNPTTKKELQNFPFIKGISELKEIAEKYNITNYDDIRIVFAFDN